MKKIDVKSLQDNVFSLIGDRWMLITAGTAERCNTMTASWGGLGVLWGAPAATIYLRPQRYTKEFVDREEYFTLAFFGEEQRKALTLCGSKSGRDMDKAAAAGLTPVFENETVHFAEAKLVIECKKIYTDVIRPEGFLAPYIAGCYPKEDYHAVYMGEILRVLTK